MIMNHENNSPIRRKYFSPAVGLREGCSRAGASPK
jgi:hypothetical protein